MSLFQNEICPIFGYFERISRIPRASGNTGPIADYLVSFAEAHGLEYIRDTADNVIIYKAATPGFEDHPTVILQGHTDMVAAKTPESSHCFDTDPLKLMIDGDYLKAEGTTLGADNGTAVAYMLSLLEGGEDVAHPALECVFTTDEEVGLTGAEAIDPEHLSARLMINMDSGGEGIFVVGCAGGLRVNISLPCTKGKTVDKAYTVTLSGFKGGHSGEDIDKGRLNAILELAKLLKDIDGAVLCSIGGGDADNVIPSSAKATVATNVSREALEILLAEKETALKRLEKDAKITLDPAKDAVCLRPEDSDKLLSLLNALPYGVYAMSRELEGAVETSNNVGVITVEDGYARIHTSVRSSVASEKNALAGRIENIARSFGADAERCAEYPGWAYRSDSALRDVMVRVFREINGTEPTVHAIHAGLECGLFSDKLDGLDCVSIGPDNEMIHTVNERLSIPSFKRTYEFIKKVLKEI